MDNAAEFSNKEQEVVDLLLQGKSNKQIASELKISNRTVEFHLTHIYQKLGVASRAEAIIQLTHQIPLTLADLRVSTVDFSPETGHNRRNRLSGGNLVKKRIVIAASSILLFALIIYFILFSLFRPSPDEGIQAASTNSTRQITDVPAPLTFEQTADGAVYRLTVNWFYIDSTRAEFEYTVCGLPIPDGLDPVVIVHRSEMVLKDHSGNQIPVRDYGDFSAGDGRSPDLFRADESCFNQVDSYEILDDGLALSPTGEYSITIPVGGELGSSQGEVFQIPLMDFSFVTRPTFTENLTFHGNHSIPMGEKKVSLVGLQINPREIRAQLCIDSTDGQQWIPEAILAYDGRMYINHGWSMDSDDELKKMCYSLLYYGNFAIKNSDEVLQNTDLLLSRLVQDHQETISDEAIQKARLYLAEEGIDFEIVAGNHGRRLDIVNIPEGMTMTEAQAKIEQALTSDLQTGEVLVLNLK